MLLAPAVAAAAITISSSAIANGGTIPIRYTCDGAGVSPPLRWTAPPAGTRTLKLQVTDPDVPSGIFVHWRVTLPPTAGSLHQGQHPPHEGLNSAGKRGWIAPCPPRGPSHRYLFILTALDAHGKAIAEADLIAHYQRRELAE